MMSGSILKQTNSRNMTHLMEKIRINTMKSLQVKKSLAPGKTKSCKIKET